MAWLLKDPRARFIWHQSEGFTAIPCWRRKCLWVPMAKSALPKKKWKGMSVLLEKWRKWKLFCYAKNSYFSPFSQACLGSFSFFLFSFLVHAGSYFDRATPPTPYINNSLSTRCEFPLPVEYTRLPMRRGRRFLQMGSSFRMLGCLFKQSNLLTFIKSQEPQRQNKNERWETQST